MTRYTDTPDVMYDIPIEGTQDTFELALEPAIPWRQSMEWKNSVGAEQVLHDAYVNAFEGPEGPVRVGGIKKYLFDPEHDEAFQERALRALRLQQSVYYLASHTDLDSAGPDRQIVGVSKVTDSMPSKLRDLRNSIPMLDIQGNAFVNDIVVAPDMQGKGIGAALLYEALQGYKDRKKVIADVMPDLVTRWWFQRMGMHATGMSAHIIEVGPDKIVPVRVEGNVGQTRRRLLTSHPWLESRQVLGSYSD